MTGHEPDRGLDIARAVQCGTWSAGDVARRYLDRVLRREPCIRAFVHLDATDVMEQARTLDARRDRGEALGPLAGVPVAVKNNILVEGRPATCGSHMLASFRAPYSAHVVEQLRHADAVIFGHTNLDEFGMGSTGETSAFGPTRNPWHPEHVPGGSSSGSAAAVAAGLCPLALGSDTGGSIRQPAALCGVLGLKPTYGRVSRHGLVAYASSLDQIGPLARNPEDLALLFQVIAGVDTLDATSAARPVPDALAATRSEVTHLRLGVLEEAPDAGVEPGVRQAVDQGLGALAGVTASVRSVRLAHVDLSVAAYYLLATSEASSNLARFDGIHFGHGSTETPGLSDRITRSRSQGFGPEVVKRIVLGTFALSAGYREAYYERAQQIRDLVRHEFDRVFEEVDALILPTSPVAAPRLGTALHDPMALFALDALTIPASLAGLPAVSVPCGLTPEGLPVGLQIVARPFQEPVLLALAGALARVTAHHLEEPSW